MTCPRSVLCFENRCSNSHRVSPSASMSRGCQTSLSRPNRIIRRCSGVRDHSLLKGFVGQAVSLHFGEVKENFCPVQAS